MKTTFLNSNSVNEEWILIDAKDAILGRLAVIISRFLKGKHKPQYTPHVYNGTTVVVINADHLRLTGDKYKSKKIHRHTGFPGGIKEYTPQHLMEVKKQSCLLLTNSVKGMLSINKGPLTSTWLKKLKIYPSGFHPHEAQNPKKIDIASFNKKNVDNKRIAENYN